VAGRLRSMTFNRMLSSLLSAARSLSSGATMAPRFFGARKNSSSDGVFELRTLSPVPRRPPPRLPPLSNAADEIRSAKSALLGLGRWPSPYGKGGPPDPSAVLVGRGAEARQRAVVLLT